MDDDRACQVREESEERRVVKKRERERRVKDGRHGPDKFGRFLEDFWVTR
jgi:hypothetical protein